MGAGHCCPWLGDPDAEGWESVAGGECSIAGEQFLRRECEGSRLKLIPFIAYLRVEV